MHGSVDSKSTAQHRGDGTVFSLQALIEKYEEVFADEDEGGTKGVPLNRAKDLVHRAALSLGVDEKKLVGKNVQPEVLTPHPPVGCGHQEGLSHVPLSECEFAREIERRTQQHEQNWLRKTLQKLDQRCGDLVHSVAEKGEGLHSVSPAVQATRIARERRSFAKKLLDGVSSMRQTITQHKERLDLDLKKQRENMQSRVSEQLEHQRAMKLIYGQMEGRMRKEWQQREAQLHVIAEEQDLQTHLQSEMVGQLDTELASASERRLRFLDGRAASARSSRNHRWALHDQCCQQLSEMRTEKYESETAKQNEREAHAAAIAGEVAREHRENARKTYVYRSDVRRRANEIAERKRQAAEQLKESQERHAQQLSQARLRHAREEAQRLENLASRREHTLQTAIELSEQQAKSSQKVQELHERMSEMHCTLCRHAMELRRHDLRLNNRARMEHATETAKAKEYRQAMQREMWEKRKETLVQHDEQIREMTYRIRQERQLFETKNAQCHLARQQGDLKRLNAIAKQLERAVATTERMAHGDH